MKSPKIIEIGSFNDRGMPENWHIDLRGESFDSPFPVMLFHADGRVFVRDVEIIPWSEKRKKVMGL